MNRFIITLLLFSLSITSFSQIIETRKTGGDGFQWIQLLNGNSVSINQGARSINGTDIIPVNKGFKLVSYVYDYTHEGYFSVTAQNNNKGIYSKTGQELISPSRGYTYVACEPYGPYYVVGRGDYVGICNLDGREIIPTSRCYSAVHFNSEPSCVGYFSVSKGDKHGICDMSGAEIIPCSYSSVILGITKTGKRLFKYKKNENEFIDLPLTLDENGYAIPYTIQPEEKKSQEELIESLTPEERERLMLLLLLLQAKGGI